MTAGQIRLGKGTAPAPSANEGTLYFDSADDQLYVIDSAGNTVGPITGGGGGTNATSLQGYDVGITPPTNGQVLTWDNLASEWLPAAPTGGAPSGVAGGDLGGSYPNPDVVALRGNAVSVTAPTPGQVLAWDGVTSEWVPTTPSGGGGLTDGDFGAPSVTSGQVERFVRTGPLAYGTTKDNLSAAVSPATTDDTSAGYGPGSIWVDQNTNRTWVAAGEDAGSMIWREVVGRSGPANALYIATNGDDTTGERGNPGRPFITLQAAVNEAFTGDTIFVGPGIFEVRSGGGGAFTWPASLGALSVIGAGMVTDSGPVPAPPPLAGTLLQDSTAAATPMLSITSSSITISGFRLENLSLSYPNASPGGTVIEAKDTLAPDPGYYMIGDGLVLKNVGIINTPFTGSYGVSGYALDANNVCRYVIEDVDFTLKDVRLVNCRERGGGSSGTRTRNLRARYLGVKIDSTAPGFPGPSLTGIFSGIEKQTFSNCLFDRVYLSGQARARFDRTCMVFDNLTSLTSILGPLSCDGIFFPAIQFYGHASNIDFSGLFAIPETGGSGLELDFTGAEVGGSWFKISGSATTVQRVKADGAVIYGLLQVGQGIDYFDKFLDASQNQITTLSTGTITPRLWTGAPFLGGSGADIVPYTNPGSGSNLTMKYAPQTVHVTGSTVAQGVLAASAISSANLTVNSGAASGAVYVTAFWIATT